MAASSEPECPRGDGIDPARCTGVARVLLATPLPFSGGELDYLAPPELREGAVVVAPLGRRRVAGVVTASGLDAAEGLGGKLKPLAGRPAMPPFGAGTVQWIRNVASWTMASPGAVLKMALPSLRFLEPAAVDMGWVAAMPPDDSLTPKRRAVLEAGFGARPLSAAALAAAAGVGTGLVKAMAKDGLLRAEPIEAAAGNPPAAGHVTLNADQRAAAAELVAAVERGGFAPFLLDGVTGSGKTEVYFEAVDSALKRDSQALVLLPEIALSPGVVDRIRGRFGVEPVVWHSGLGDKARHRAYRAVVEGGARVVVGARSSLFLPFPALGVIVVDEEHDPSYKQDDHVAYHARDMAVMRASQEGAAAVLVSATPSLESEVNADSGRYRRLGLPHRTGVATLPEIRLVDTGKTPPERGSWIAPPLVEAVGETLAAGQQAMLFLNRRGYAPVTLCRRCGEKLSCPNCSAWLVAHKSSGLLRCHHCGHGLRPPEACPSCGAEGELVPCGPGVERLAEEVGRRFPEARQAVLSSDTVAGADGLSGVIGDIREGRVDIVIGTQMVAKGHHFPGLTLVGVVDADLGLAGGDLRAAEHTWQLLVQVAGRAGRVERQGTALLQTAAPDTAVLQCLVRGDRQAFLEQEKAARRESGMPPFGRLASVLLSSPSLAAVDASAGRMSAAMPRYEGVAILGPAPAPIAYLRGRHRQRFIVRTPRDVNIQAILRDWLEPLETPSSVRLQVDIDPYHFT